MFLLIKWDTKQKKGPMLSSPRIVELALQSFPCMVLWLLPALISVVLSFNVLSTGIPEHLEIIGKLD